MNQIYRQTAMIFPTPLRVVDFEDKSIFETSRDYILSLPHINENKFMWETENNLNKHGALSDLVDLIKEEVAVYWDELGIVRDGIDIQCMWANVAKSSDFRHSTHVHANSFFSGVVYLNVPDKPGNIGFRDPRPAAEMWAPNINGNSDVYNRVAEVEPYLGRMILFPSWLAHGTKAGEFLNDYRIALSFNVMPIGMMDRKAAQFNYTITEMEM
jgi:uncharacterized protein (TIGR02466 family)